jgi:anti-sigma factor ChrR (cupin superfamily)
VSQEPPDHAARGLAELYVLGVLEAAEAAAFEVHLAYGCPPCQAEVAALRQVLGVLALSGPRVRPPRTLRARVLARVQAEASGPSAAVIVRARDGQWETAAPGVTVKYLFHDARRARRTMLMRVAPGIRRPAHRHGQSEEIFVLEGALQLGATLLRAGDYSGAALGTLHPETRTDASCVCLCFAGGVNEPTAAGVAIKGLQPGHVVVRAEEGTWQVAGAGVATKPLRADAFAGTTTALVRMQAGARLPEAARAAVDEIFVLGGSGYMAGRLLSTGDYYRGVGGSRRDVRSGARGCTLFMVSSDVGDAPALPHGG